MGEKYVKVKGRRTLALLTVATDKIPEQYCRAGPSKRETTARSRAWFWQLLDDPTNADGLEAMAMIRKGQIRGIGGKDIKAQARFIASLFEIAA